ncbi:MAG: nucleotide disphospho-sugar-binding domain-containing protein [Microthrixaceae bacterium]
MTKRLVDDGHEVLVLAHEASRERIARAGASFTPFTTLYPDMDCARPTTDPFRDWEVRSPFKAALRLRDVGYVVPVPSVAAECDEAMADFGPDVVVYDFMLLGAAVAAEAAGVPAVGMVHCPYLLPTRGVPPYGFGLRRPRTAIGRGWHAALRWLGARSNQPVTAAVNAERSKRGLDPLDDWTGQLFGSARLLVFTAPELDFAGGVQLPANVRYVGPAFEHHDETWRDDEADARKLVVISLSTTYMRQEDLAQRILDAVGELPVRALFTAGPALHGTPLRPAANTTMVPFVPHRDVFPHADLVVTHAGWGTINAALSCGLPMVCIPCGRDQPDGARRVADAGAGVIVKKTASAARIRAAIAAVLDDPALRAGAQRMATAMGRQDGAEVAVREIVDRVPGST